MIRMNFAVVGAAIAASAVAAPVEASDPPTPEETQSVVLENICFDLRVEVTRHTDGHVFAPQSVPLCVEMPEIRYAACEVRDVFGDWECAVASMPGPGAYYEVQTPQYRFSARGDVIVRNAVGVPDPRGSSSHLYGETHLLLQDVWDYRLSKILAAHPTLMPVEFASLILPGSSTAPKALRYNGRIRLRGEQPTFSVQNGVGPGEGLFSQIQSLAFDAEGREHGVHITATYGETQ